MSTAKGRAPVAVAPVAGDAYRRVGAIVGGLRGMTQTLEILPYDPSWPQRFARERDRIARALGPLASRIDHVGSTAVSDLAAKPVIDIQVSAAHLHPIDRYVSALAGIGYLHRPHADDAFAPFFHRPAHWPHTHHVHVVEAGGEEERRQLAFRDWLRAHPETARRYEALKRELAPRFAADRFESRNAYSEAKGDFIAEVTRRALIGASDRG